MTKDEIISSKESLFSELSELNSKIDNCLNYDELSALRFEFEKCTFKLNIYDMQQNILEQVKTD
ncbi:MAG: hypothetical protein J6K22_08045 [Spirochaetaceae bacterium]|nr:hypothetical protein [Spirochaetaceae bacterium]